MNHRTLTLPLTFITFLFATTIACSETTPTAATAPASATTPAAADQIIEKGGVTLIANKRIELRQGKFCLEKGPIELLVCATGGKAYESIISVDVNPEILHFCLLLLKLQPGDPTAGPQQQGDPLHVPTGSPIVIKVKWTDPQGKEHIVRGEELCWNVYENRTMEPTSWVFSGSRRVKDESGREVYWANVEKSIITVFRDPFSVIDLPLASSANDETYVVNTNLVPPVNTPCTIIIEPGPPLPPPAKNANGGHIIPLEVTATGRILLNKIQIAEPLEPLKQAIADQPKDTYQFDISHAAPPASTAAVLDAIITASAPLQSVATVRLNSKIEDIGTITFGPKTITFANQTLTIDQAVAAITTQIEKTKKTGLIVHVETGADLNTLSAFLKKLPGFPAPVIRFEWTVTPPAATPEPKTK